MEERIVKLETNFEHHNEILKELSKKIDNITDLTISVKEMATEVKLMREELTKLTGRVDDIEKEPAVEFKELKKSATQQIVTFVIGAILSGLAVFLLK